MALIRDSTGRIVARRHQIRLVGYAMLFFFFALRGFLIAASARRLSLPDCVDQSRLAYFSCLDHRDLALRLKDQNHTLGRPKRGLLRMESLRARPDLMALMALEKIGFVSQDSALHQCREDCYAQT